MDDLFISKNEKHLKLMLKNLKGNSEENRYLISWILYFLKSMFGIQF